MLFNFKIDYSKMPYILENKGIIIDTNNIFLDLTGFNKEDLLNANAIEPNWGEIVFDINMPIVYYTLTVMVNGQVISIEEDGPAINDLIKKYINKMQKGNKIIIENVQIKTPEGRRKIEGLVLKVK